MLANLPRFRARPSLVLIVPLLLALSTLLTVAGLVPGQATVSIQVFTADAVPRTDDVTIRVYRAGTAIEEATDRAYDEALAVAETVEGGLDLKLDPGEYLVTAWKNPSCAGDGDHPRLVASQAIWVLDTVRGYSIVFKTEKTRDFTLKLRLYDSTYPGVPLDDSTVRLELRGVRKEVPYLRTGETPYRNGGHWKGFKEYGTHQRKFTYEGYFLATNLDREVYLVQVWDGCHLIGRFEISMNEDKDLALYAPYEKTERTMAAYYSSMNSQQETDNTHTLCVNLVDPEGNPMPDHPVQVQDLEGNVLQEGTTTLNGQGNAYTQFTDLQAETTHGTLRPLDQG